MNMEVSRPSETSESTTSYNPQNIWNELDSLSEMKYVYRGNFNSKSNTMNVFDNGDPHDAMGSYIKHKWSDTLLS
jgi:hypothetical protein